MEDSSSPKGIEMDDWEYSDDDCPKCGSQLAYRRCAPCEGEGCVIGDDEEDGWEVNERCDMCDGKGYEEWCRACGWDMNFKCFLSPEYERAYQEKQANATK